MFKRGDLSLNQLVRTILVIAFFALVLYAFYTLTKKVPPIQ